MEFELKDIIAMAEEVKANPQPTGDEYLDERREGVDGDRLYYRFFYELTKKYRPETIVELGGCRGTSAAHFAGGCRDTKVITVDHHTDPGDDENKNMMLEACANFHNMVYCQGWTCNEIYEEEKDEHHNGTGQNALPKVLAELDGKLIDLLFIDSWHVLQQAQRDWNAYKNLLKPNALVICDDIAEGGPGSPIQGMTTFFKSLSVY